MERLSLTSTAPRLTQGLTRELHVFYTALQYLTRIPVPAFAFQPEYLARSSRYFPLVGLLLGLAGAGLYALLGLILPLSLAVAGSLAWLIWITGAFHEDGFADACDGLGGGWTRERVLEIMKDSRLGSYGAVGLFLLLAIKLIALLELAWLDWRAPLLAWPLAHGLSRFATISLIYSGEYVRASEQGARAKPVADGAGHADFLIAGAAAGGTLCLATAWRGLALPVFGELPALAFAGGIIAAVFLMRAWFARLLQRRLGGYTGDTLGALQQLAETAIYLTLLALPEAASRLAYLAGRLEAFFSG